MNKEIESILLAATNSKKIIKTELIQKLWSGYGQLSRVQLENQSVIVKHIQYPTSHYSDFSHQRKVKSYEVEINWYKEHNQKVPKACIPSYITSGTIGDEKYLVLEDLKEAGFQTKSNISWEEVKLCLKWLAHFHGSNIGASTEGLWEIGTYWNLDTRPDELETMDDPILKNAAALIDKKLNDSKFQTLVHGDAKLANFLFKDQQVSAVDFQYTGGGVGVKDLAYFLSSIYESEELFEQEDKCLNYYFEELKSVIKPEVNGNSLEQDWRELYPYAWCDFYRFLKGWQPRHWKINTYIEQMKQKVLACI